MQYNDVLPRRLSDHCEASQQQCRLGSVRGLRLPAAAAGIDLQHGSRHQSTTWAKTTMTIGIKADIISFNAFLVSLHLNGVNKS